jgi:O-antigen ligase
VIEYLVNTIKWMIPGLLLLFGARDRGRMRFAVICLIALFAFLAYGVLRQMPLGYALNVEALEMRALRVLERRTGYHRVDLAMVLAGAAWAPLAARGLVKSLAAKLGLTALSGVLVAGLIMTGGRTGYVAWAITGLILSALRWRHNLLLVPVAIVMAIGFMPGVEERMLQGVEFSNVIAGQGGLDIQSIDAVALTSGRTKVWPYVVEKIREGPVFGFGRLAHIRTGILVRVYLETDEAFGHPHNGYLQFALDNGLVGLGIVVLFYGLVLWKALKLFLDRDDPLASAVGGLTAGLVLAFLAASFGAQTFYPIQSTVGMWCAMALTLRIWHLRQSERQSDLASDRLASAPVRSAAGPKPNRVNLPERAPAIGYRHQPAADRTTSLNPLNLHRDLSGER